MAFADGVLDEPHFSALAEALETDAALAARLEALIEGADLARKGYAALLAPAPPALETAVRSAIAAQTRRTFWSGLLGRIGLPLAGAAVAAALAVVVVPHILVPSRPGGSLAALDGPDIAAALDTLRSGESRALPDGLEIAAVSTFTDGGGTLCREFETAGPDPYVAVACRSGEVWQVRFAILVETEGEAYRPASGLDPLETYLDAIGAGPPLLDDAETEALRRP